MTIGLTLLFVFIDDVSQNMGETHIKNDKIVRIIFMRAELGY